MMNPPLVTIAMVTYNSGKYVREAISSVLASSYPNLELVISDDNSKDNTWEIVNSFTDPRIRRYRNEQNIGEYKNRNRCIELAAGKYLLFIDGDDMIYPLGLEFMVRMFDPFPECGMALMRWYKRNLFYPVLVTPKQFYEAVYFNYGFNDIAFANTLFRTEVLRAHGGLSTKYRAGDNHIRLVLGKEMPTLLISDGLTWWRETPNQASARWLHDIRYFFEQVDMELEMLTAPDCPLDADEIKAAKKNIELKIIRQLAQLVKAGKLKDVNTALKRYHLSVFDLLKFKKQYTTIDPFSAYNPENPCTAADRISASYTNKELRSAV